MVKFGVSGHLSENPLRKWPEILHADVSWSPTELIKWWLQFVDFSNFGAILTWVKFEVSGHFGHFGHIFWVSGHYLENVWEWMSRGSGGIFLTLCVEFCLVFLIFSGYPPPPPPPPPHPLSPRPKFWLFKPMMTCPHVHRNRIQWTKLSWELTNFHCSLVIVRNFAVILTTGDELHNAMSVSTSRSDPVLIQCVTIMCLYHVQCIWNCTAHSRYFAVLIL